MTSGGSQGEARRARSGLPRDWSWRRPETAPCWDRLALWGCLWKGQPPQNVTGKGKHGAPDSLSSHCLVGNPEEGEG